MEYWMAIAGVAMIGISFLYIFYTTRKEEAEATTANLPVTGITDKMLDAEPDDQYTLNDLKEAEG